MNFLQDLGDLLKAVKPKPNPAASAPGQPNFLPNGTTAKSDLNRTLLHVNLGKLCTLLQYKARRTVKAFLSVPPHFSWLGEYVNSQRSKKESTTRRQLWLYVLMF